jgi:WS/DGAT/MGAT family acyltransferase
MTPLNRGLGPNRRFALQTASLADLKVAGKAQGATVNDALLAAVTGMLRRYMQAAGQPPRKPLVALVPVSVRRPGEEGGNHIATVLVDLPVGEHDPAEQIVAIHATMAEIKSSAAVRAGALLAGATGWAPPLFASTLARATGELRAFNLVVSNVPGPQQPFWLNGCRLLAVHPAVPLNPATQGLSVGIVSYDGAVCFGLLADRDLDPPLAVAAAGLAEALAELAAGR